MKRTFLVMVAAIISLQVTARQVTLINDGNWSDVGSWTQVPACGDTITIPVNKSVTVNQQHSYLCGPGVVMKIKVYGTLQFVNGYKLTLPCGSVVEIMVGGLLKKASAGGGNSTMIEICGNTVWNAGDGPISGYAILPNGSLPVSWLSLEASRKTATVEVNWNTASEYNNDYFTVQRSTDKYTFKDIARIPGAGSSTVMNNYTFNDESAPAGVVYYRLRQTDYDGKTSLSKVVAVSDRNGYKFELIAVVTQDGSNINVVFSEPSKPSCTYLLTDPSGKTIDEGKLEAGQGIISRNFNTSTLVRGGIYLLQLSNGREASTKRFIVN